MANKTYVISDIHGHYQVYLELLKKIEFDDTDQMYVLGDVCDRGPQSINIFIDIDRRKNITLIKGNHEIMMRNSFLEDNKNLNILNLWKHNGGEQTIRDYHCLLQKNNISIEEYLNKREIFFKTMIAYIDNCPSFIELNINNLNYVLIHAGINPNKSLYEQTEEECAWMREFFYKSKALDNKIIIFGHTPTCFIRKEKNCDIWFDEEFNDKIGIDGGLGSFDYGQLNCLCLETMEVTVVKKQDVYTS